MAKAKLTSNESSVFMQLMNADSADPEQLRDMADQALEEKPDSVVGLAALILAQCKDPQAERAEAAADARERLPGLLTPETLAPLLMPKVIDLVKAQAVATLPEAPPEADDAVEDEDEDEEKDDEDGDEDDDEDGDEDGDDDDDGPDHTAVWEDVEADAAHWQQVGKTVADIDNGHALVAFARAAVRAKDVSILQQVIDDICPKVPAQHAATMADQLVQALGENHEALAQNLVQGAAVAPLLRHLAILWDQRDCTHTAGDLIDAAFMLEPQRSDWLFTRCLVRVNQGRVDEARADALARQKDAKPEGDFLLTYLGILFDAFGFVAGSEKPETDLDGLPEAPAQTLEEIRATAQRLAQHLMAMRSHLIDLVGEAKPWMPPDLSSMLTGEVAELRSFCDDDDNDIDETIDCDGWSIPQTLMNARGRWSALCWLCWSCGLDRVALPGELKPPADFGLAAGMACNRLWRLRDRDVTGGRMAKKLGKRSFAWCGIDVDAMPPQLLGIATGEQAEVQAVMLWLAREGCASPWISDLRAS